MCGDRDAETKVNDMVFAYFADDRDTSRTLGVNAGTAWAIEKRDDPKILKLILPVASLSLTLGTIVGTKGLKLAVSGAKLAVDMAKIVQILGSPSSQPKSKGDDGFMELMGSGVENVFPNTRSEFIVISMTTHAFDNKRRFFTHNRVLSSGYLQTWIEGGPLRSGGETPSCCVPHMTQYAQAAFNTRYTSSNMIDQMSNNYSTVMPEISDQIGYLTAPSPGCDVKVEYRQNTSDVPIVNLNNSLILDKVFAQPFDFEIYDIAGKCIQRGRQLSSTIDLQNLNLTQGVYVLRASGDGANITHRFVRI
jgi:hypothetical protein